LGICERRNPKNGKEGANMITPQLITEILALASIVVPITQAIKKWLKVEGNTALVISAVVTILMSLWRVLSVQPFDWSKLVILVVGVFLEANGIYHFGSYAIGKMTKGSDANV
jgi:uncharacterized membrane protein